MQVRIDERFRHEVGVGVDLRDGFPPEPRGNIRDPTIFDSDISERIVSITEARSADRNVECVDLEIPSRNIGGLAPLAARSLWPGWYVTAWFLARI